MILGTFISLKKSDRYNGFLHFWKMNMYGNLWRFKPFQIIFFWGDMFTSIMSHAFFTFYAPKNRFNMLLKHGFAGFGPV